MNIQGARKAALALAAMLPVDRRWMLTRLPAAWHDTLLPLIDEAVLMVKASPDMAREVLSLSDHDESTEIPGPVALITALDRLPAAWAARMLTAVAPDHAEMYRATCSKDRSEAVRGDMLLGKPVMPPALGRTLAIYLNQMSRKSSPLASAP